MSIRPESRGRFGNTVRSIQALRDARDGVHVRRNEPCVLERSEECFYRGPVRRPDADGQLTDSLSLCCP
jgi:hypothetical protein